MADGDFEEGKRIAAQANMSAGQMLLDSDEKEEQQAAEGSAGQEVFSKKEYAQSRESREREVSTS